MDVLSQQPASQPASQPTRARETDWLGVAPSWLSLAVSALGPAVRGYIFAGVTPLAHQLGRCC